MIVVIQHMLRHWHQWSHSSQCPSVSVDEHNVNPMNDYLNNAERCRPTTVCVSVLVCCWPFPRSARELSLPSPEFFRLSLPVSNLLCHQRLHLLQYGQSANTQDVVNSFTETYWNIKTLNITNLSHNLMLKQNLNPLHIEYMNIMNKQLFRAFCIPRKTNIHCLHLRCQLINRTNRIQYNGINKLSSAKTELFSQV